MSKKSETEKYEEVFEDQEELDLSSIPDKYEFKETDAIEKDKKHRTKKNLILGIIFVAIQAIASGILMFYLIRLGFFPDKYLLVIGIVLIILLFFTILSQTARNGRIVGRVYAVILTFVFAVGSYYLIKTENTLNKVTTNEMQGVISDVHVIVLKDSPMTGLQDLSDKNVGIQKVIDRENTDQTIKNIGINMTLTEFESYPAAVEALYQKTVDAIIINQAFCEALVYEDYPDFLTDTKILESYTYTKPVEEKPQKEKEEETKNEESSSEPEKELKQTVYHIYLCGNDSYGTLNTTNGRNDVNIIATVNLETHTILLTNTPRDYYVEMSNGGHDKLTHVAINGLDESIYVLENLYDIDLDYYVRVNFDGFEGKKNFGKYCSNKGPKCTQLIENDYGVNSMNINNPKVYENSFCITSEDNSNFKKDYYKILLNDKSFGNCSLKDINIEGDNFNRTEVNCLLDEERLNQYPLFTNFNQII